MTPLPALCGVCKSHANSPHLFGFHNLRFRPYLYACNDPVCVALLPKVYKMPKEQFDAYEMKAIREGGEVAGSYLDTISTYDLSLLTNPQWETFLMTFEHARQAALRRMIENDEAPF